MSLIDSEMAGQIKLKHGKKVEGMGENQARDLKGIFPQSKENFSKKKSDLCFRHYIVLTILC